MISRKQIGEIIKGWGNLLLCFLGILDKRICEISKKRYKFCKKCTHRTKINTCNHCGCYLPAKTKSMDSECPDGLWGIEVLEDLK